jgi:hypothetical protein
MCKDIPLRQHSNTTPGSPSLNWSATQTIFEQAESDVLMILDCCHAATTTSNTGRGVTELIAACGFESMTPAPGPRSLTNCLIGILNEWDDKFFSAAMLHHEILFRLKHERPERSQHTKRWREVRSTPIHVFSSTDPRRHSINLSKMHPKTTFEQKVHSNLTAMHANKHDHDNNGTAPPKQKKNCGIEAGVVPTQDPSPPCILFSVWLKENMKLNFGHWKNCLFSIAANVMEFIALKMGFLMDNFLKTRATSLFRGEAFDPIPKSEKSPTATEQPKFEDFCGICEDVVLTERPVISDLSKSFSREISAHYMAETLPAYDDLCRRIRLKEVLSRPMLTADLQMACSMDHISKSRFKKDTHSFMPLQYPSNFPSKTTTAPLEGPKRGPDDAMTNGSSPTQDDLQWDATDTDENSTLDGHERSSRASYPSEGLTIDDFLRTSSASLKRDLVELLMSEYYQIFDRHNSSYSKSRVENSAETRSSTASSPPEQSHTGSSASTCKRKASGDDDNWADEGDDKPTRKRPRDDPDRPRTSEPTRRYACPYNKHDPQKFRRKTSSSYNACDNIGFDTIGHTK